MQLREPPRGPGRPTPDPVVRWLLVAILVALVGLATAQLVRSPQADARTADAERSRQIAAKLQAAGALDEAAALYERYLDGVDLPSETTARIAFSLGSNYLQDGQYDKALRWFYEAELLGVDELRDELSSRIVHCLDRMGRHHAAQAALESRVRLEPDAVKRPEDDPVVARVGQTEIRRSELDRALDGLPPELAGQLSTLEGRQELLKKYVADELLWRRAVKLEYDRDPEVARRHAEALKQLAVARFVERELLDKIEVDEADLRNYFEAHRDRYAATEGDETAEAPPTFEEVRLRVERDYRLLKMQTAYDELIETELATQDVELFPERLTDGS